MPQLQNANFPVYEDGRTYHLGTKPGDIANRIITVGDLERARRISALLDAAPEFEYCSSRGFLTITGSFKSVPVSIVAIGMGTSMMDFFVREARFVVRGPMAIVRFGSCGGIRGISAGQIAVATKGSVLIQRDVDAFSGAQADVPYRISKPVPADPLLSQLVANSMRKRIGSQNVVECMNATADSFYSSQGRIDPQFTDRNEDLIPHILQKQPDVQTLEMESFTLLHLAHCSRSAPSSPATIRASACTMVFMNRMDNSVIPAPRIEVLEREGGLALLEALVAYPLESARL
ncbi:nucleoside phosphorylase domain-containing protein [Polychytrium aggregatum]|uniref:nucleoside phosphorylase domain-containing protein n=1 Tax=Polychytrium aggregatum TaxID=110093 RepID=UPI0022FF1174|nr:nucleoside phosphorylase domain-containing protein [Polychytrium aggregatum]KAI9205002.1 nucleoside phosphorylase domain-containing protein [Polychytrium aggregatum]